MEGDRRAAASAVSRSEGASDGSAGRSRSAGAVSAGRRPVFEAVVVGGGPAGVTAALRARAVGAPVALVERALTHSDVWGLRALPASVAVVGAAATGCQLASVFAAFGARVQLLDAAPRILGAEDELVSRGVAAAFARRGIAVVAGIDRVERIEPADGGLRLVYAQDGAARSLAVGAVVAAVGWAGNLEDLDLAAAGVASERGFVTT